MPGILRIVLVIGSVCFFVYLIHNLRKSKISVDMSVLWIIISFVIVVMAIFPSPFIALINILGIESPVNGILVFFIFTLLLLTFYLFKRISILEYKITELAHKIGIEDKKNK